MYGFLWKFSQQEILDFWTTDENILMNYLVALLFCLTFIEIGEFILVTLVLALDFRFRFSKILDLNYFSKVVLCWVLGRLFIWVVDLS